MRRDVFQAIADPTRRAIITLIALQAMTPNAIAEHFDSSRQAVSKHLRILTECQLVKQEQQGREIYYQLDIKKMKEIDKWLEQFRKIWEERFSQLDKVLSIIKSKKKMKNNLPFDFTVDKTTNTVFVNRAFAADLALVWEAFTKQEILDQWWAPKPWSSKTMYMKFEVGGRRFYAMVSPEGQEHWSIQDFTAISTMTNFKFVSAFTDKDENKNTEFPRSNRNLDFIETNGITTVRI